MRIILSTAPARYWQTTNFMLTNFPPLGLAVAAAAISPPHEVRIVENSKHRLRSHDLFRHVKEFRADVVAFTNNFYPDSLITQTVARQLKEAFPGLITVVGGQAPSFLPEVYLDNGIDYVVLYEAEHTFRELIDALPLRPGVSRKYLRLAMIGAMAWSLVWYSSGKDGVDEIAKQIVNLFRAAKDD